MDNDTLQAIQGLLEQQEKRFEEKLDEKLAPIKEDLQEIKEEAVITRHNTNMLLKWAEKVDRTVNVGLYPATE